jgi:hypothetical protein
MLAARQLRAYIANTLKVAATGEEPVVCWTRRQ